MKLRFVALLLLGMSGQFLASFSLDQIPVRDLVTGNLIIHEDTKNKAHMLFERSFKNRSVLVPQNTKNIALVISSDDHKALSVIVCFSSFQGPTYDTFCQLN